MDIARAIELIELQQSEVDREMKILRAIGKDKQISINFEKKFNEYRKEKQKVFRMAKENMFSKREEYFLHNIYGKSKHQEGLHIYQKGLEDTKKFKKDLLMGRKDPKRENLDPEVRLNKLEYQDVFRYPEQQK
jgi:hypothetical protein